jgi:hypothetical protein
VENYKKTMAMNMQISKDENRDNLPICLEYSNVEIFETSAAKRRQTFCGSHFIRHLILISL